MKPKTQIIHWLVDAILLLGFLLAFFLDLTGLGIHQWLGVFLGALVVVHLLRHQDWVTRTLARFLAPLSWRVRVYAGLDFVLLLGFGLMILTGLAMSTWFNLPLADYTAWYNLHVGSSVATLLVVVAKLALHWRWIVITFQKMIPQPRAIASPQPAPVPTVSLLPRPVAATGAQPLSRRQFLVTMGFVGAGAALALSNVAGLGSPAGSPSLDAAALDNTNGQSPAAAGQGGSAATATTPANMTVNTTTQTVGPAAATPQPMATPTLAPTTVPTAQPTAYVCTYRCRKGRHCAFPGQCHSYTDQNNNGYCDLGECS
ncbi:MAG TPA: hypothetical protein PKG95_09605 [Anaerolineaceae bacterium]|nr:hypothetical protein [Anaerolineaceae bacterium]